MMEPKRELNSGGNDYIDEQNELNRRLSLIQTLKTELIKQEAAIKKTKNDLTDNQLDVLQKEIEGLRDLIEATEQEADELTASLVEDTHVKE